MIPNVRRGHQMVRLMSYLVGAGKHNEHTAPHLVAGSPWVVAWHAEQELTVADARAIGKDLEAPQRAFDVDVNRGHVWHCSLAIEASEGQLGDDEWGVIAETFMARMGFISVDPDESSLRWVAVRHGLSGGGNDHLHLVVCLVAEDGSVADVFRDWPRAQSVCRQLEIDHGLRRVGMNARSHPGYKPGEIDAEARRRARAVFDKERTTGRETREWGQVPQVERDQLVAAQRPSEAVRLTLARTIRACAVSSLDEAEFVRRVRRQQLLIRPWFARGTHDVVTGYKVALRPRFGERPIWFGGGTLARDLSLPRLREAWPDAPQTALAASAEWQAAWRGIRVAAPGRETTETAPVPFDQVTLDLDQMRQQLRGVRLDDHATWARVAHQASGALAAWSVAAEPTPGPLAAVADALARSATYRRPSVRPHPVGALTAVNAAAILAAASAKGKARDRMIQAMLLRQFMAVGTAIAQLHHAAGDVRRATHIHDVMTTRLMPLIERLDTTCPPAAILVQQAPAAAVHQLPAAVLAARPPAGVPIPPPLPEPPRPTRPWVPSIPRSPVHDRGR